MYIIELNIFKITLFGSSHVSYILLHVVHHFWVHIGTFIHIHFGHSIPAKIPAYQLSVTRSWCRADLVMMFSLRVPSKIQGTSPHSHPGTCLSTDPQQIPSKDTQLNHRMTLKNVPIKSILIYTPFKHSSTKQNMQSF